MKTHWRRDHLLTFLRNLSVNHASTRTISRTAEAFGKPLYYGQYGDDGLRACRSDLRELEDRKKVTREQNYNGPAYWTVI